jgi:hypothetical protein
MIGSSCNFKKAKSKFQISVFQEYFFFVPDLELKKGFELEFDDSDDEFFEDDHDNFVRNVNTVIRAADSARSTIPFTTDDKSFER